MRHKILALVMGCCIVWVIAPSADQDNTSPQVLIKTPREQDGFHWNTLIPFEIQVSDFEDGQSEYQEIPEKEVFMIIAYMADSSKLNQYLRDEATANLRPLSWMGRSNCFNCHMQREKLIGPSFEQIAHKYQSQTNGIDTLVKRILNGSIGLWGDQQMPAQADLEKEKVQEMARWILKNCSNTDIQYIPGTTGAFRSRMRPENENASGKYVLRAFYRDHGQMGITESSRNGIHTIVLHPNGE